MLSIRKSLNEFYIDKAISSSPRGGARHVVTGVNRSVLHAPQLTLTSIKPAAQKEAIRAPFKASI